MNEIEGRLLTTDTDMVRRMLVVLLVIVIVACCTLTVQVYRLRTSEHELLPAVNRNAVVLCKEFHLAHPTITQLPECLKALKENS